MGLNKFKLEYYKNQNFNLKKKLEKLDRKLFFTKNELDMRQKSINNKLIQQKEFINYLERQIEYLNNEAIEDTFQQLKRNSYLKITNEILQEYKEIIGVSDENKRN